MPVSEAGNSTLESNLHSQRTVKQQRFMISEGFAHPEQLSAAQSHKKHKAAIAAVKGGEIMCRTLQYPLHMSIAASPQKEPMQAEPLLLLSKAAMGIQHFFCLTDTGVQSQ
ncbi:hypothetical protein ACP4OV_019261 [Aristida adscensionis]